MLFNLSVFFIFSSFKRDGSSSLEPFVHLGPIGLGHVPPPLVVLRPRSHPFVQPLVQRGRRPADGQRSSSAHRRRRPALAPEHPGFHSAQVGGASHVRRGQRHQAGGHHQRFSLAAQKSGLRRTPTSLNQCLVYSADKLSSLTNPIELVQML